MGHSAGCLPLIESDATYKIVINPLPSFYLRPNVIVFRAISDWMIPYHVAKFFSNEIMYKGKHSDMPITLFRRKVIELFNLNTNQ